MSAEPKGEIPESIRNILDDAECDNLWGESCGATPKQKYGPVIEMEPRPSAWAAAVPPGVEWKPNTAGGQYP